MNEYLNVGYIEHKVFGQLTDFADFYKSLSESALNFLTPGARTILHLDTYIFRSLQGTLESIHDILLKGRISDSYSLLRKFYDSTVINVYLNLYIEDEIHSLYFDTNIENIIKGIPTIEDWIKGTKSLPEYKEMGPYIKKSAKLKSISDLLQKDQTYKNIRQRCNDHMHYNYCDNLLLNDNQIYSEERIDALNTFSSDLEDIIIQHLAYIFYLNDQYMMSSDYMDSLESNITPDEDSPYWVAPFIQGIFDKLLKPKRPDITLEIMDHSAMQLL